MVERDMVREAAGGTGLSNERDVGPLPVMCALAGAGVTLGYERKSDCAV